MMDKETKINTGKTTYTTMYHLVCPHCSFSHTFVKEFKWDHNKRQWHEYDIERTEMTTLVGDFVTKKIAEPGSCRMCNKNITPENCKVYGDTVQGTKISYTPDSWGSFLL